LTIAHQLNASVFWELTKYLSQETDYVAWYPMIKVFEYMSTVFPFSLYNKRIDIKVIIQQVLLNEIHTAGKIQLHFLGYFIWKKIRQ